MRKKTIKIQIYHCWLTIIVAENFDYVEKKYNTVPLGEYGAVTLKDLDQYRHFVMAFTDKDHLSNIAHEIVHLKNYIYSEVNAKLDTDNDEPEAYLTGYLFDEIYNFLHKLK
jgi:hypothetical protein